MVNTRRRIAAVGAGLVLVAGLVLGMGCGEDGFAGLSLTLTFTAETVPADTAFIKVYVLPVLLSTGDSIDCDRFVGPTADKKPYDYSSEMLFAPRNLAFDPSQTNSLAVPALPEGLFLFLVEANDAASNLLAFGCGKGRIQPGEKAFITIYLAPE